MLKKVKRFFSLCNISHGAISREGAVNKIGAYGKRSGKYLGRREGGDLLVFGHQGGNYERYPKDPNEIDPGTFDISKLMKQSYDDLSLDGIEIDLQIDQQTIVEQGNKDVYVVHNPLEYGLKSDAIKYLRKNSLEKVLTSFIDKKYYKNNKLLYMEIKCDHSERLDSRDEDVIATTIRVIDGLMRKYTPQDAEAISRRLGFASFNYRALERISELTRGKYDLFFIAASNRILGWMASKTIYRHFNYLGKRLKQTLSGSGILTGVWFDPCGINNFGAVFNGINRTRKELFRLAPLKMFVSTYLLDENEYYDRMEKETEKLQHVEGLFFEIKSQ